MKKKCKKKREGLSYFLRAKLIVCANLLFLIFCMPALQANAEVRVADVRVSISKRGVTVADALHEIEQKSNYNFVYNNQLIDVQRKVDVDFNDASLSTVLNSIFNNRIDYKIIDRQIVLTPQKNIQETNLPQEHKEVKGVVRDEAGQLMPGVSVVVKGTLVGTATDADGNFSLSVPENTTLVFSFIGYQSQEVAVAAKKEITVALKPDVAKLDEVVVVGYGTTKVKDLTGAVSSVGAKELEKTSLPNVAAILQGKAAGVLVSPGASKPGEPVKIRVRGSTSLEGTNEPLYVVDGVPVEQSDMVSLNPNDIESMDILKDASAAAIYGSRAANGVIIITTKRGRKSEKPILNLQHYTSIDREINNFDILSADDYRRVMKTAAENTLLVDPTNKTALGILDGSKLMGHNTDWYDLLSQTAITNNTELSVRGGAENIRYFVSLGVLTQDGVLKGDNMTRYSGRLNLDWDVTKALKFGTNLNLSYMDQKMSGEGLWKIKQFRPDVPVYDENGDYYKIGTTDNPVALTEKKNKSENFRFVGTMFGELELIRDLKLKSSLSLSKSIGFRDQYFPSFLQEGNNYDRFSGKAIESSDQSLRTLWDNTLSFNRAFNEIHSLDAVVGVSFENNKSHSFSATGVDFPMDEILNNLGSASKPYNVGSSTQENGLLSTFGRINYKLFDKYMFTFTGRYDGSSRFGSNNRFGFFPSAAFAWKINKEAFLADVKQINDLKLRVSGGKTGTQNIGNYNNKDLYGTNDYLGKPGVTPTTLGNNDLKWETTKQYDVAVDYGLFDYRFTGSLGYYYKDTDDLLWYIKFPPSLSPFTGMYKNVGRVVNKGWEFALNADVFRETAVKWNVSFNLAANRNKVKSLIDEGAIEWGEKGNMHGGGTEVLAEGYPVGAILGYKAKGIFQSWEEINAYNKKAQEISGGTAAYYYSSSTKPGHVIYEDVNGDGFVNSKDQVIVGNPEPKFFGGFSTNISWKRFSLYAMFNYSVGGDRTYNNTIQNIASSLGNLIDYNLDNRWSPTNTGSNLPALYLDEPVAPNSNLIVYDASYLKLSNLRLQYELPVFFNSKFYKGGQLYASVSNVFTITKYPGIDPSIPGSTTSSYKGNYDNDVYPGVRTYTAGLKLNF